MTHPLKLADDERALLRAALVETSGPDAWRTFVARQGGIDHLDGERFSLLPMVFGNLRDRDPAAPELARLRGIYRRTWYGNQMSLHAAAQAVAGLEAAGVAAILVGGCALTLLHGGDGGLRPIRAVELAVTATDRRRALHALAGLGWARPRANATAWVRRRFSPVHLTRGRGEQLLLHCVVRRPGRSGPEHRVAVEMATIGGVTVRIPSAADQLLFACLGRRPPAPAVPLRWIPDAALVIRAAPPIDDDRLRVRARARGASCELSEALQLLGTEFDLGLTAPTLAREPTGRPASVRAASRLDPDRVEAFRQLALDSVVASLAPALRARGVRPVLIKGPATARWLYADPRERPYGDIDLLLAPEDFAAAGRVMADHGFSRTEDALRRSEYTTHHDRWIRPGAQPIKVELHRTLLSLDAVAPALAWERLTADTATIEVGGVSIETLGDAAAALTLALHAQQHGVTARRPMTDLERALERVPEATWRRAALLAEELQAEGRFAAGLQLLPAGRDLCHALGRTDAAASPRATAPEGNLGAGIENLVRTRGARRRLVFLAGRLVPSTAYLRASSPLARRGRLGIAAAYAWRPFDLLGRLPAGLRTWLSARRARQQTFH